MINMDNDILKLLPQKAFRLISIKETIRIGSLVTRSIIDKKSYEKNVEEKVKNWKLDDVQVVLHQPEKSLRPSTKDHGEKILKVYFSQFFDPNNLIHLDLRQNYFSVSESLFWVPSKMHYAFSPSFVEGVCSLYEGFYFDEEKKFEKGLSLLGILRDSMNDGQKKEISNLFYAHFGEGRIGPVRFSLKKLQDSFNTIFSYFIKEDIPLNPEFALLGAMLVTLYTTLQDIGVELSARDAFVEVVQKYRT